MVDAVHVNVGVRVGVEPSGDTWLCAAATKACPNKVRTNQRVATVLRARSSKRSGRMCAEAVLRFESRRSSSTRRGIASRMPRWFWRKIADFGGPNRKLRVRASVARSQEDERVGIAAGGIRCLRQLAEGQRSCCRRRLSGGNQPSIDRACCGILEIQRNCLLDSDLVGTCPRVHDDTYCYLSVVRIGNCVNDVLVAGTRSFRTLTEIPHAD